MSIRVPLLPRWVRWAFVVVVGVLIFALSIVTAPPETAIVPGRPDLLPLDKWRHVLAYAAFGGSLAFATAEWRTRSLYLAVAVIGVTVLYGMGIEAGQAFLPERYFSLGDAWANAVGGLFVVPWFAVRGRVIFVPLRSWLGHLRDRAGGGPQSSD